MKHLVYSFGQKVLRYQTHGLKGIQTKSRKNHYSKEFKQSVMNKHFVEGIPMKQLARKYNNIIFRLMRRSGNG